MIQLSKTGPGIAPIAGTNIDCTSHQSNTHSRRDTADGTFGNRHMDSELQTTMITPKQLIVPRENCFSRNSY